MDSMLAPQSLGEALRLLMERAHLGRDAMAKAVGVSAGSMSNYLRGTIPPITVARRITRELALRLELDPDELWSELGQLLDDIYDAEAEYPLDVRAEVLGRIERR